MMNKHWEKTKRRKPALNTMTQLVVVIMYIQSMNFQSYVIAEMSLAKKEGETEKYSKALAGECCSQSHD